MIPHVREDFRSLIPPLSTEERAGLEADILRDGKAYVPLIVWGDVLLDGHNRFEICNRHGLPYTTQPAPVWIEDERDARIWIRSTALNRRNLGPITRAELHAGIEEDLRAKAKERQREGGREKVQQKSAEPVASARQTRVQAAKAAGMSHPTYEAAKAVAAHAVPELRAAADCGAIAVSTAADLVVLPPDRQREIASKGARAAREAVKALRQIKSEQRREERTEKLAQIAKGDTPLDTVSKRFPVVYADPPWRYEHIETESRAIENQYPTMEIDEICRLPLDTITTDDAILFLWVTSPMLDKGLRVVREWGFTYRTSMVWVKDKIGMGYYARQQHELLLIATKGNPPTPPPSARPASVVCAPRGEHSSKPAEFYGLIEAMYPTLPRVELFCRTPREGWSVWGNQS